MDSDASLTSRGLVSKHTATTLHAGEIKKNKTKVEKQAALQEMKTFLI